MYTDTKIFESQPRLLLLHFSVAKIIVEKLATVALETAIVN